MLKEIIKNQGYLWGVLISTPFCLLAVTNPLKVFFILLAIHPLVFAGMILLRRKFD
jgi:hypothetical protein